MNPIGAIILVVLMAAVYGSSRRMALLAMMAGAIYLPQTQQLDILGFNLWGIRFLELAGFYRVVSRNEFSFHQLNRIDRAFFWLYGFTVTVFVLRSSEGVTNQIGMAVDAFLCYVTFRGLIGGVDDFQWFLRASVFVIAPYALLVTIESVTWHNPFELLGGTTGGDNWMRHGRPRCFGSFRQPDTLGMFAASFLPLYIGLACIAKERKRGIIGIGLCLVIVYAANCGGAASGAAMGLLGWGLWRFRSAMRLVRWGIVGLVVALALVMKAPVWFIFDRASLIFGGDGWHRSYLIDVTLRHFGQWWLAGMPITNTNGWFPFTLEANGGADITNQFISFGLSAGVTAIILFIILLKRAFSNLGKALEIVRSEAVENSQSAFLLWGLGVMLAVHILDWFAITYFDQMFLFWFMQIAAISSISSACLALKSQAIVTSVLTGNEKPLEHAEQVQPGIGQTYESKLAS